MTNFGSGTYNPYTYVPNTSPIPTPSYSQPSVSTYTGQMNNVVIGVQGIDAAKAYPLPPNTRGYFLDTEEDFIYIKEIDPDNIQRKPVRILKCEEITEDHKMEKRKMLEEMMANARNEAEREVFRNQIMELDRM